jgi:hypothetical protein
MQAVKESPWKVALALALAVLAGFLVLRMLLPGTAPGAAPAVGEASRAGASAPRPAPRRGRRPAPAVAAPSLDPTLRLDILRAAESTVYEGTGRNIFRAQDDPVVVAQIPEPVAPARTDPEPARDPGPPPPPPIPLKFFGFASRPGEPQQVFLSEGEDVYIAKEGDIVGRRYRVLRITTSAVEIEDLLSNRRQTIPLTEG